MSEHLKEVTEGATWISGGRALQTEGRPRGGDTLRTEEQQ